MMFVRRLGGLLRLLVFAIITQTTLINPASAGHNCNRWPYHCYLVFGTYEDGPSDKILPEHSLTPSSSKPGGRVFIYTQHSPQIEVELADDAREYFKKNPRTKALGFMILYQDLEKKGKPVLVNFFPADLKNAYPSISSEEALRNYISAFEQALLKK